MVDWLKSFGSDIQSWIQRGIQNVLDGTKRYFDDFVQFFVGIWDWLKLTYDLYFVFLKENYERTYEVITGSIRTTAEWLVEQVKFLGKWLWETAIYLIDGSITAFVGFIDWVFNLFPNVSASADVNQGTTYFIQYAMILNKILPIKEGLIMLGIVFGILAIVVVVRLLLYIYRLIPFKSA